MLLKMYECIEIGGYMNYLEYIREKRTLEEYEEEKKSNDNTL